jgi:hypothetical protein
VDWSRRKGHTPDSGEAHEAGTRDPHHPGQRFEPCLPQTFGPDRFHARLNDNSTQKALVLTGLEHRDAFGPIWTQLSLCVMICLRGALRELPFVPLRRELLPLQARGPSSITP